MNYLTDEDREYLLEVGFSEQDINRSQHVSDRQVVEAADAYHRLGLPFVNDRLAELTGEPLTACDCAIERALTRDLVECGVSERTCWPTEKGRDLLAESTDRM